MDKQKSEWPLVEVTLAKPHTHAGLDYAAGDTILVNAPERDWLIAQQIIAAPKPAKEQK